MPMNTTFETPRPKRSCAIPSAMSTCPAISPASRFCRKPIVPVAQNEHAIAQPTCEDTQTVRRRASPSSSKSGMSTVSTCRPEASVRSSLMVPSLACRSVAMSGQGERGRLHEPLAEGLRQVRHRLEGVRAARPHPAKQLPPAKLRLAHLDGECFEGLGRIGRAG